MSLEEKSAAAVAHSGYLKRKRPAVDKHLPLDAKNEEEAAEPAQIRRLLFVDFVECLCLSGRPRRPSNSKENKQPPPAKELYNFEMLQFLVSNSRVN